MNGRHAICVVIDGLRASALGCYGNTSSRTPSFDEFASRSSVVERLWADSPIAKNFYRSAWHGTHALRTDSFCENQPSLRNLLQNHDTPMRLITDDPSLSDQFPADALLVVDSPQAAAAEDIVETAFAGFCGKAIEQLENWHDDGAGSVTWIHSRGLLGAWDAPHELRAELLDEDDPEALDFVEPPLETKAIDDPDRLLLFRTAYAAQMTVIDSCFGALWNSIEESMSDREALMMLTSASGFSLGEHGHVGHDQRQLYSEQLHLPWLMHVCDDQEPRPRIGGLAQPADIHATWLDWLGIEAPSVRDGQSVLPALEVEPTLPREVAVAAGESGQRALVTPDWMLRHDPAGQSELFAKPDDRWEHNDVAIRCPHELEQLSERLAEFEQTAENGGPLPTTLGDD